MAAPRADHAPASPRLPLSAVITRLLSEEYDLAARAPSLRGKRVLVRCDLNVPLSADGDGGAARVADATRVDAALPTLRLLIASGARVVVTSHLGRPRPGKEGEAEMRRRDSLAPVAALLAAALGDAVFTGLAADCAGPSSADLVARLQDGQARNAARAGCRAGAHAPRAALLLRRCACLRTRASTRATRQVTRH